MKIAHPVPVIAAICVACASCSKKKDIPTFRVATEEAEKTSEAEPESSEDRPLRWKAPDEWVEKTPGQFQTALYQLESAGTVSISKFPGDSGGISANVNRWRKQIGLEPTEEPSGEIIALEAGDSRAMWFELRGGEESILAAIVPVDDATWFFKFTAPSSSLDAGRSGFMGLLKSIEIGEKHTPPTPPGISLVVPEGWEKQPASAMRAASFRIPSSSGIDGDVSVIPLPGEAGSNLENVNRWRAQLKMQPLESAGDDALGEMRKGESNAFLLTHMVSEEPLFSNQRHGAISTAILRKNGFTWFFKMAGEEAMLQANRVRFEEFVRSAVVPES